MGACIMSLMAGFFYPRKENVMAEDQRLGALHWIDHYAVPTNDLDRWVDWNANVLGATEPWRAPARRASAASATPFSNPATSSARLPSITATAASIGLLAVV